MPVSLSSFGSRGCRRVARRFSERARTATVVGLAVVVGLATIHTAGSAALFSDGFESGNFSQWTTVRSASGGTATVQQADVAEGKFAARLSATSTTGSFADVRRALAVPLTDLTVNGRFEIVGQGPTGTNVPLVRLFDGSGRRLLSVYRQNQTDDKLWVQHSGSYFKSWGDVPLRRWSKLEISMLGAGTSSGSVELRIDDATVYKAANLPLEGPVAMLQIGNDVKAQPFEVVVDDVSVTDTTFSPLPPSTAPPTTSSSTTTTVTTPPATEPPPTTTSTSPPATSAPPTTTTTRRPVSTTTTTTRPPTTTTVTTAPPPSPPPGTDYYVDSVNGNDAAAGTNPGSAWKTLPRATKTAFAPGDRLLLARGSSWTTRLSITRSGTAAQPITITAYGNGNRPLLTGGSNGDCIDLSGNHLVVAGLEVANCTWAGIAVPGDNNRVDDNIVRNNITGIYIKAGGVGNKVLRNNVRDNNRMSVLTQAPGDDSGAFGILLWGDDTEVAWNTITGSDAFSYDYGRDGAAVEIYGGQRNHIHHNWAYENDAFSELGNKRAADNTFAYNLVRNNLDHATFLVTRGGKSGFGPILRTKLLNNTVYLTGANAEGVICDSGCDATVLIMKGNVIQATHKVGYADQAIDSNYNVFWGGLAQFRNGANDIVADPRFVNPARGDFHLAAGSPAIDRLPSTPYGADLDSHPVPQGTRPDAGAFERTP
jgi:parallel beta-helix repeat protein